MRPVLILLLIAAMISCPLHCASGYCASGYCATGYCATGHSATVVGCSDSSHAASADTASEHAVGDQHSCCDACEGSQSPSEGLPQQGCPCEGCDCQTCICHGATIGADPVVFELLTAVKAWLPIEWLAYQPDPTTSALDLIDRRAPMARIVSGRATRIGFQSFQI